MSQEDTQDEQQQEPETDTPTAAKSQGEVYTADQLEAIKNQIWAEARRKYQKVEKAPKPTETKQATDKPADAKAYVNWRDTFADATEDLEVQFGRGQRRVMRESFLAEKPSDPAAWIRERCEAFGIAVGDEKQEQKQQTEPPPSTGKPASDFGAPTSSPVWERPTNPYEWTREDIDAIYARKGRREGQRMIRKKVEEYLRGASGRD